MNTLASKKELYFENGISREIIASYFGVSKYHVSYRLSENGNKLFINIGRKEFLFYSQKNRKNLYAN